MKGNEILGVDRMIPLKEVGSILGGLCKRTVLRMIAGGELPRPVMVRKRACLPESEVHAFLEHAKLEYRR